MISDMLDKVIRTVPDFPKEGINFKDITPLLMDSGLSSDIIDTFISVLDGASLLKASEPIHHGQASFEVGDFVHAYWQEENVVCINGG